LIGRPASFEQSFAELFGVLDVFARVEDPEIDSIGRQVQMSQALDHDVAGWSEQQFDRIKGGKGAVGGPLPTDLELHSGSLHPR
jgi:hypothetical protein